MGEDRKVCGTVWAVVEGVALISRMADLLSSHLGTFHGKGSRNGGGTWKWTLTPISYNNFPIKPSWNVVAYKLIMLPPLAQRHGKDMVINLDPRPSSMEWPFPAFKLYFHKSISSLGQASCNQIRANPGLVFSLPPCVTASPQLSEHHFLLKSEWQALTCMTVDHTINFSYASTRQANNTYSLYRTTILFNVYRLQVMYYLGTFGVLPLRLSFSSINKR